MKKKYEEIIYKKIGKQLEGGWGDVINGLMLLGGAVIIKKIAETPMNVSQVRNEGTGGEHKEPMFIILIQGSGHLLMQMERLIQHLNYR